MNEAGDKLVTNGIGTPNRPTAKRGKAGPAATVKFGSASVPVYLSEAIAGNSNPTEQDVETLIPQELLRMAREWKRHPDQVLQQLTES